MKQLQWDEVNSEPTFSIDGVGRLFRLENRLYRAISPQYSEFYKALILEKKIQSVLGDSLITTEIAPLSIPGFDLILEHRFIPLVSYCMEWTAEMLKDAALLTCDISEKLSELNLTLKDAHPWNIVFDRGRPIFIDWGSIVAKNVNTSWPYEEFRGWFLLPLLMMAKGKHYLARTLMLKPQCLPQPADLFRLIFGKRTALQGFNERKKDKNLSQASRKPDSKFFASLRESIQRICIRNETTEWTQYESADLKFSMDSKEGWPEKLNITDQLLNRIKPKTVLDLGCNRGWFSRLASRQSANVAAVDLDDISVEVLYSTVKKERLSILPVVMDICFPTPSHGLGLAYHTSYQRFKSDFVLALAISHHLIFKRSFQFDTLVNLLDSYTKRFALVEFVPPEDEYIQGWATDQFDWYSLKGFEEALARKFSKIEIFPSTPNPRVLLLCEK